MKWWNDFYSTQVVSNDTVLIFSEDKEAAQAWAERTFPHNAYNAWIGKCGEFVFSTWAGERRLPVSRVDLKHHPEGTDEFDFLHTMLFGGGKIKLDIKTFQIKKGEKRNWWNVRESCLEGSHKQDIIIFAVIDEDFRIGKIIGQLTSDQIKHKCKYVSSLDDGNGFARGYYRVYLDEIQNSYYLQAILDHQNQVFNGLGFAGFSTHKAITEMIKDYPLDPMFAYHSGSYDWLTPRIGGTRNLRAKPTLQMFLPLDK